MFKAHLFLHPQVRTSQRTQFVSVIKKVSFLGLSVCLAENSLFLDLYLYIYIHFVCFWHNRPQWARASSFTSYLDHTQRRTTVGRTPLDEICMYVCMYVYIYIYIYTHTHTHTYYSFLSIKESTMLGIQSVSIMNSTCGEIQ